MDPVITGDIYADHAIVQGILAVVLSPLGYRPGYLRRWLAWRKASVLALNRWQIDTYMLRSFFNGPFLLRVSGTHQMVYRVMLGFKERFTAQIFYA